MNHARSLRLLVGGLAASLTLGAVGISAAQAKPPTKPGAVPNLTGVANWHAGTTYDVAATWSSVANATGYRASVIKGGVTLVSNTVNGLSWDPTITSGPGSVVVQVQAVVRHRKGRASKYTVALPDKVAPTGQFTVSKDEASKLGTITQTALDDDSGMGGITRTVNWHEDVLSVDVPWTSGATIDHTYGSIGRYVPTVTLTDAANNSVTYTLDAIVLGDVANPAGSVAVSTTRAWTSFTHVVATPSGLLDDVSPADMIGVDVTWGDGTSTASKGAAPLDHVYTTAGSYDVTYTIVDEGGNATAPVQASTVVVRTDKLAPVVRLLLPRTHKHSVKFWRLLNGKAKDAGTGVKKVSLRAVEKRGTKWFGYRPATGTWVKAATKAAAFKKGRAFTLTTNLRHRWSAHVRGLRKGTLVYKVSAIDKVSNASKPITHKATLTKP